MQSRLYPRFSLPASILLAATVTWLAGCGTVASTNVAQVSPDVYQVTVKDRTKAFEMDPANYKHRAISEAMDYAESKGKVAVPVGMTQNTVGLVGEYVEVDYQFRLVDKDDPRAKQVGAKTEEEKPVPAKQPAAAKPPETVRPPETVTKPATRSKQELYDDLMRLDDLRKKGIITQAEFESEKQKLLNPPK